MISLFKSNNPAVVFFYIPYLVLFRICFVFTSAVVPQSILTHQEPLSGLVFHFLGQTGSNIWVSLSLSAMLVFIQALLINSISNENKITARKNYLPGALYIIFVSFFKESLYLTPVLLSITFLIICIGQIFAVVKKEKSYGAIFDIGFNCSLAMLFYFPSSFFILFAFFGLGVVRPFSIREWIGMLMGVFSPLLLVFTWYFWNDMAGELVCNVSNLCQPILTINEGFSNLTWIQIGTLAVISIFIMLLLPSALYSSLIQVRKFITILLFFLFLVVVSVLPEWLSTKSVSMSHLGLIAMPLAIMGALVFLQIKRKAVSEVIHIILILLVLAGQYIPLFNIL